MHKVNQELLKGLSKCLVYANDELLEEFSTLKSLIAVKVVAQDSEMRTGASLISSDGIRSMIEIHLRKMKNKACALDKENGVDRFNGSV